MDVTRVAAFTKRCGQTALTAPPAEALVSLGCVLRCVVRTGALKFKFKFKMLGCVLRCVLRCDGPVRTPR